MGSTDGLCVGCELGTSDGTIEGKVDGNWEGNSEGSGEGSCVGLTVKLGSSDGVFVGHNDQLGWMLGGIDGSMELLGFDEVYIEGIVVGANEGKRDGG